MTQKRHFTAILCLVFAIVAGAVAAEENWRERHLENDKEWVSRTGLPLAAIQQLRRAAGIEDDLPDTLIVHIDDRSFKIRGQVLLVVASGNGFCLSAFVLGWENQKAVPVWSISELPNGEGICRERTYIPAVSAISTTSLLVRARLKGRVRRYRYDWNGNTFVRRIARK